MIPRYTLPEMGALWTDEAKLATWVEVEVLACEAHAELGVVPAEDLAAIRRARCRRPSAAPRSRQTTNHDVIAFLTAFMETIPSDGDEQPGALGPLRDDVVGSAGHRAGRDARPRDRPGAGQG